MNAPLTYFWPCFAIGLAVGVVFGTIGVRRDKRRNVVLIVGALVSFGLAALWHGPLGGADQFTRRVERNVQLALNYYEMTQITAHLHRAPLTRQLQLSGPADDFQHSELVRLLSQIPGVHETTWSSDGGGLPLIAEGLALSLIGFLFGLLLAYLGELRRRYNAQWNW
jgi:hypothetical protein